MWINLPDMPHVLAPTMSIRSAVHVAKMVAQTARDRLTGHARGTRLTMGNALAARLLRSALDAGVTLWNETPMLGFERDERSEERRVGKECVSTCRSRWPPEH